MLYWGFHLWNESMLSNYLFTSAHIYWISNLEGEVHSIWDWWTNNLQVYRGNVSSKVEPGWQKFPVALRKSLQKEIFGAALAHICLHLQAHRGYFNVCHTQLGRMGLKWLCLPILLGFENTQLVRDRYWIQTEAIATFLMVFGAHVNIFINIKVKILVLIKWSYRSPKSLYWLLSLEPLSYLEHVVQFLFSKCHLKKKGVTLNHIPVKYRYSIKVSTWIMHLYLIWGVVSQLCTMWSCVGAI
jgi:hypothetical protein